MFSAVGRRFLNTSPDLLIVGGGPGGYVAAIRAAQLGFKTVCVEKEDLMGGTCLREGCIPSKFMLNLSHKYYEIQHDLPKLGIKVQGSVTVDMKEAHRKKKSVLLGLSKGIEFLQKKYKTELVKGEAFINDSRSVTVTQKDGKKIDFTPKTILLATGSKIWYPASFPVDEKTILTSRGALNLPEVPKSLCVIGGGVIGLELGSVYSSLGSKVTIVDLEKQVGGPAMDKDAAKTISSILTKRGINFMLGQSVTSLKKVDRGAEVVVGSKVVNAEKVLVSVGRRPNLENFGLEKLNLKRSAGGSLEIGPDYQTSVPGIYAIGDIVPGPQLAHKAEEEGIAFVEYLAQKRKAPLNYNAIPSVIYTSPEVATVGLSEDRAKESGIDFKVFKFPYQANSRARAIAETEGFVKFVCSKENKVLGTTIVGSNAGEAIMEGTLAINNGLTIDSIADTTHPHPTLSEAVLESARGILGHPIHM